MLTQEDMAEIIKDAKAALTRGVVESVKKDIQYQIQREVTTQVSAIVEEYVKAEVGPAVHDALLGEKSVLIDGAVVACAAVAESITKAMVETITNNLADGWKRKKVVEALLS